MKYYPDLPCRFVVIPRAMERSSQIIMIDAPEPFHIYHFGITHQSEDGSVIHLNAVCLPEKFDMTPEHGAWLSNASIAPGRLQRFELNLVNRSCKMECVDQSSSEFPVVHPFRHSYPLRYTYLMANARGANLPYRDIVKNDDLKASHQVWNSEGVVGEPAFAPRFGFQSTHKGAEDEGWLLVQMYRPDAHLTEFVILDATDLSKGPVARIKLDRHIPYGFHGTWLPRVFINEDGSAKPPRIRSRL
eukprot:TRINITY_DN4336_c0_g1_i3.p1 TRINITY_DN4336_c0_g1~~TRINITY_DN4336_c0_g1_i3.p1  ORF type:complete len:276 (-),score=77.12 TRINITY_DN4336_c0_g1_i3:177-911(-)